MLAYIWPMALVVITNTVYQICSKGMPGELNPFAALTVTYLVGAAASFALYYILTDSPNILKEYAHLNWAPFALGVVIVGLEVGWIYAYRAGWQVSTGFIVQSAFLAVLLIFVGYFLYKEKITLTKLAGVAICLVGLYFVNK